MKLCTSAACLGLIASVAAAQPVWNIAEHGAVAGRDVTAVINEGLRTQHQHGLPVYVPHGRWGVTSTIELPKREGGALIGAGASEGVANPGLRGLGSVIEWWGPAESPMLRLTGTRWRVENLTLRGVPRGQERTRAGVGVLITWTGRGLGTGKHEFRNVLVAECGVGIQCGSAPAEPNNDNLGFERLVLHNCGVGYRVINSQSMSHWFDRLEVRDTPVAFQFFGGGMLHARNVFAIDTTLLEIRRNTPPRLSPGANNAVFRVENLKVDAQHGGDFCLVDAEQRSSAQVTLECAMVSGRSPFTMARLAPGMQLVLRDVTSPTVGARVDAPEGSSVVMDNVRVKGLRQDAGPPSAEPKPTAGQAPSAN